MQYQINLLHIQLHGELHRIQAQLGRIEDRLNDQVGFK
jgi:hypothetical protein